MRRTLGTERKYPREKNHPYLTPTSQPAWGVSPHEGFIKQKVHGLLLSPGAVGEGSRGFHSLGTWRNQDLQSWGREVGSQSP